MTNKSQNNIDETLDNNESYQDKIEKIKTIIDNVYNKYVKILWEWTNELNVLSDYTRNEIWNAYWYFGAKIYEDNEIIIKTIYWDDEESILQDYELKMKIYNEILNNEEFTKLVIKQANWGKAIDDKEIVKKLYSEIKK